MKNLAYSIILGLGLILVSCSSSEEETKGNSEVTTQVQNQKSVKGVTLEDSTGNSVAIKIAYVEIDSILLNYEAFTEANQRLEQRRAVAEGRIERMKQDYLSEQQKAQQKIETGKYTQSWADTMSQQLYMMEMNIQKEVNRLQDDLAKEFQRESEEQYQIVTDLLKRYAEENGYHFILSKAAGGNVLYADGQFDVTEEVLNRLNSEFQQKKASK